MIGIIDYGVGNLFSLRSSLQRLGVPTVVTNEAAVLKTADKLILPGVGAFEDAMQKLADTGLDREIIAQAASGKPLLGICLGMQVLFEKSYEFGEHSGLGLLSGQVVSMAGRLPVGYKIPHIGWNRLTKQKDSPLLSGIGEEEYVYFVHSYYAEHCESSVIATTDYGLPLTAAVCKGNICGCQFHPEKSGAAGMRILSAFCGLEGSGKERSSL